MTARRLVLLRHGKAGDASGGPDAERPLTDAGQADSRTTGEWLAKRVGGIDLLVVSPMRRARETAELVAPQLPRVTDQQEDERVADNTLPALLALVRSLPDETEKVLVVGHNPGLSDLASELAGEPVDLSAAQAAVLDWDGKWADAATGKAALSAQS